MFLEGRSLLNNLINLGLYDVASAAVRAFGHELAELEEQESDPGLGNGGLGRLAAVFSIPARRAICRSPGMGLSTRYGLFRQESRTAFRKIYP